MQYCRTTLAKPTLARTTLALAAALILAAAASSPAMAAHRHKGGVHPGWHGRSVAARPFGFGTGAGISGPIAGPGYGVPFGYNDDHFDADFSAYTHGYAATPDADTFSCARRYRSYDPASGTYLGRDGTRHSCPG